MTVISSRYKMLLEKFPFLTMVRYGNDEFIGIVGNADGTVFNMYCWDLLKNEQDKLNFLKLGEEWWFESNHSIPINILLLNRWKFQPILRSLNNKNVEVMYGPVTSFGNLIKKRSKRRNIQLIKKY
jgi:hypothetical protein|tara:strand:+ start:13955 stop:14332 length:378 start_codon:yes stop_codon:yes gene_type:complete